MRFALINNRQVEAEPGLSGSCPGCDEPVIAKCGTHRIHHWAHRSNKACDSWWESETEWHRSWKNHFPIGWQEIFLPDELTGEKHIADVRTDHGLVIEFQHSPLNTKERTIREKFYQNMVWIVDGSRLKKDFPRFTKGTKHFEYVRKGIFQVGKPEECFPSAWLQSSVPVIFDFKGTEPVDDPLGMRNPLYCLFPLRIGTFITVVEIPRTTFIETTINGKWILWVRLFTEKLCRDKQAWENKVAEQRLQLKLYEMSLARPTRKYGKGRRF